MEFFEERYAFADEVFGYLLRALNLSRAAYPARERACAHEDFRSRVAVQIIQHGSFAYLPPQFAHGPARGLVIPALLQLLCQPAAKIRPRSTGQSRVIYLSLQLGH
jgi:hypothetical protein